MVFIWGLMSSEVETGTGMEQGDLRCGRKKAYQCFLSTRSLLFPLLTTSWHLFWKQLLSVLKLRVTNVSIFVTFFSPPPPPKVTCNFICVWQLHLVDANGQKLLVGGYRYRHSNCEGWFTAASLSWSPSTVSSCSALVAVSTSMRFQDVTWRAESSSVFVTVCVHTETHVHAQRKLVSSWKCLVMLVFALSKSLGGKESAELQRGRGKS